MFYVVVLFLCVVVVLVDCFDCFVCWLWLGFGICPCSFWVALYLLSVCFDGYTALFCCFLLFVMLFLLVVVGFCPLFGCSFADLATWLCRLYLFWVCVSVVLLLFDCCFSWWWFPCWLCALLVVVLCLFFVGLG